MLSQFVEDPFGMHGPGAVFDSSEGKDKWSFGNLPGLPLKLFKGQHSYLPQGDCEVERRSRLCVVPKDFRGHRLICIEPKELMFYQQGLMRTIFQIVETNLVARACIDFHDQRKSNKLSRSLKFSTIDLSDASDNLRLRLCRYLFPKEVLDALTKGRSSHVELPNGDVVKTTTMFTMGNALCFPIETLVFYALALSTMLCDSGQLWRLSSPKGLLSFVRSNPLRVFGDDIIVPNKYFESVCKTLAGCGLVVNKEKSCFMTPVREACGSWFFLERDCTIVKLKLDAVENFSDWISVRETVKLLFQGGFTRTAKLVKSELDKFYRIPLLGLDRICDCAPDSRRFNKANSDGSNYQRLEFRLPSLSLGKPDVLNGDIGLYSYFTGRGSHVAPRDGASCVKWGWESLDPIERDSRDGRQ
jgi:hypothetical protein